MVLDNAIRHSKIEQLSEHWRLLHPAPDRLPGKQHFDPVSVPTLLPNIYLIEVVDRPPRFRFRLLGENIIRSGGPGRRGVFVDELPRTNTTINLHDQLVGVLESRKPGYYKGPPTLVHHAHVTLLEGIMLPLATDGIEIDNFLCLTVYHWLNGEVA